MVLRDGADAPLAAVVPKRKALKHCRLEHPRDGGRENPRKGAVRSFSPSKTDLFRKASGTTVRGKASANSTEVVRGRARRQAG